MTCRVMATMLATLCTSCVVEVSPGEGEHGDTCGPAAASAPLMRRLTASEYRNTIADLFGIEVSVTELPEDPEHGGFANQAAALSLGVSHAEAYQDVAERIAAEISRSDGLQARLSGCEPGPEADDSCVEEFLRRFGRRIYRRPITDEEVAALLELSAIVSGGDEPFDRIAITVEAMLQSPKFLFRVERGLAEEGGRRRLTDFELATRLSYLLWQTAPDDDLLDAAEAGALATLEALVATAREMLADERARVGLGAFTSQWFDLERILEVRLSPDAFPDFDQKLAAAMHAEAVRLIDDHVWEEGASLLEVYRATYGYGSDRLASHYDAAGAWGSEMTRIDFSGSEDRGGLFTTAGFLVATSKSDRTSPIHRGKYVREIALCETLPPPPPDVPLLAPEAAESDVEASRRHMDDPACSGCHQLMDPIGWGLDRYAADGRVRTSGSITRSGRIEGFEEPVFSGGVELGRKIAAAPAAADCAVRQTFRWSFARSETDGEGDACTLEVLRSRFEATGQNLPELLIAVVESDAFRYLAAEVE